MFVLFKMFIETKKNLSYLKSTINGFYENTLIGFIDNTLIGFYDNTLSGFYIDYPPGITMTIFYYCPEREFSARREYRLPSGE